MAKIREIGKMKVVRDVEWNEWIVKCWDSEGKRFEAADYHTDDKSDAIATMAAMAMAREVGKSE
jgi:hypothetical protein